MTTQQIETVKIYKDIEALKKVLEIENGVEYHYSIDQGKTWSCLMEQGFHPVSGVANFEWEACVEGKDEYCETIAQTWYDSIEEMMECNRV